MRLITSRQSQYLAVYKICAVDSMASIPKMKVSENAAKVTTPCDKEIVRFMMEQQERP